MKRLMLAWAAIAAGVAFAGPFEKAELRGVTDKAPVSYKVGEPIDFTVTLTNAEIPADAQYFVKWTRTGDDGKKESGMEPIANNGSFAKPGFVRIEAKVVDAQGKDVKRDGVAPGENWFGHKEVFFSGGAAADIAKLKQGEAEPKDFDAFWAKQKAELKKVPMKVKRWEVKSPKDSVHMYAVQIDCAGGRPVTGYLSIPKRCDNGAMKLPARIEFDGYGTGIQRAPKHCWFDWQINFHINAHGYDLEKDGDYYKQFFESIKSNGKGYAFDPQQNADPEKAYFHGMALRVMRALEFVKTRGEWNGKDLIVEGGSQGGLQTSWAAGLDKDVTLARPYITWGCNWGFVDGTRIRGPWHIPWAPGLGYYDAVSHIARAKCRVEITRAGLGDYTCPPSGLALFYNAIKAPKATLKNNYYTKCHSRLLSML